MNNQVGIARGLLLKQKIRQNIDKDSIYYKTDTKYHYENKEYQDHDAIVNHFLDKNPIITEKTSSNPNKIIKDYEYQQLMTDKIYGVDRNDYVKVYKNALGKVVLSTCSTNTPNPKGCVISNKTSEQRALESYVNEGLIRPKYTYAFGGSQNWYDTPTEAKNAYKNSEFTIKKSLFYNYKDNYYNAFNKKDLEKLKAIQLEKGYYFDGKDSGYVDTSQNIKTFWDTKKNFDGRLKQSLANIFLANINELVNYKTKIVIEIKAPSNEWFKNFTSSDSSISFSQDKLTITEELRNGADGIAIGQLLYDLHHKSAWESEVMTWGLNDQYERNTYSGKINNKSFSIELHRASDGGAKGYPKTHPEDIQVKLVKADMNDNITLNSSISNPLLNKLMNLPLFSSPTWNVTDIVDSLYAHNEEEVALKTYGNSCPSNWDQRFTDKMFDIFYEKLETALYNTQISSPVIDDWTYGSKSKPIKFSVYESQKYYNDSILNKKIVHKTKDDSEQVTWTEPAVGNFTTSWKKLEK